MASSSLRDAFRAFTTGCALITTNGPKGPNVMAAEWTFNVSYRPFLILVVIDPGNVSHDMILESREFGVSLVAEDQAAAMGFAGHYSKADTDKVTSEVFELVPGRTIHAPLVRGALLNAECRLLAHYPMGDHTGFLGEVIEFSVTPERPPLVLHQGSHRLGERIVRNPSLLVAVTPMHARTGDGIRVTGELTGPERGNRAVEVSLRTPTGEVLTAAKTVTDAEGTFEIRLGPGPETRRGPHVILAQSESLRGQARVEFVD